MEILFNTNQIHKKVNELAHLIANDYKGKKVVLVCVLNGAYIFFSDLSKEIWNDGLRDFEVDFVRISSYGKGKKSSGKPFMTKDTEVDLKGKEIVIVEDIVETGYTLKLLFDHLLKKKPSSIKICTLLSKPLRKVNIEPDYLGFEVNPNDWVEGYGLDTGSKGRGRQEIIRKK